ncbi:hypothetical protein H257_02327 [Aphanomyces astaci]|uniref:DUF6818 domain-containing protein n=1 Tax=Aphanomyces astaci TaxID=112090 RepID=W4H3A2_APHAT|nr:hypothetical protein H257_02327 [Aphanomyces astaci]ETV85734.1 hypothetical protein H257_02327 [Aphanomyces astaci]|eukprot:XP_009824206.1 hypothetical protein H257_02327 [Aphanomyces astaci]
MEAVLPAGRNVWVRVESAYNSSSYPVRDVDALKSKFGLLRNHAQPTGDPLCPQDVVRVKRISRHTDAEAVVLSPNELEQSVPEVSQVRDDRPSQDECPSHTGLNVIALRNPSQQLKRITAEGGMQSYVANKRRSIDKFIYGAAEVFAIQEGKDTGDKGFALLRMACPESLGLLLWPLDAWRGSSTVHRQRG